VSKTTIVAVAAAVVPWLWFAVRGANAALDLIAIGLPLLILFGLLTLVVWAIFVRRPVLLAPALSLLCFGAATVVLPWSPTPTAEPRDATTVLTANIGGPEDAEGAQAAVASLLAAGGEVVVVDELSPQVDRLMRQSFPFHAETFPPDEENPPFPAVGVFSAVRIVDVQVKPRELPGLRVVLDGRNGPFVLYAMHVPKAGVGGGGWSVSFSDHNETLDELAKAAEAETLPVVVAGDLNTPDRAIGYRRLTQDLHDGGRASWTGPTSVKESIIWRLLALRIDHILHSPWWCSAESARLDIRGSDHLAVRVDIGPCAAPAKE
jgi:endonuclease/exonuclease/phosphatase (EEP) superfamily protein YafD